MSDSRQDQIDSRIDYLERDAEQAIAEKKAQVSAALKKVPERYEKEDGKLSMYEMLVLVKEALDRDPNEWVRIEKQRLTDQREYQQKVQSNRIDYERWLEGKEDAR